jgi:signal transduction histidine kinase
MALVLSVSACAVHGDALTPGDDTDALNIGPHVEVLEDPGHEWTIEQVTTDFAGRFRPSTTDNPSFGFTRSTIWLRFTLDLSDQAHKTWFLVQRHPIIDHLTLFTPDGAGGYREEHMGDALPFRERLLAHRAFIFPLSESGHWPRTYYLKVEGKGALSLELQLATAEGLVERTYSEQLVFGLFYGALMVMLIYNLILSLSIRHPAYFWYIFFMASFIICFLNINGFGLQYIWPRWPVMNEYYALFASLAMVGLVQYSRSFLDLAGRFPLYERIMRGVFYFSVLITVLVIFIPPPISYHLSTLLVVMEVSILTVIGWKSWRRGHRVARLYVLAWTAFMVGCLVFAMDNLRIIPHTLPGNYAPHIGSLWAALLLSLALADRIKLLEDERDVMASRARDALERHLHEVEQLDRDKLVFLEYLSHELNTPLNWLANATQLEQSRLPREVGEALDMVRKGQDRLMELVATSLRYFDLAGRSNSPPLSHCRPRQMLDALAADRSRDLSRESLRLENRLPETLTVVACERELEEVLAAVLDNAIQFSPDGGLITATAGMDDDDQSAVLRICDPGVGMTPEQLSLVFEPFFMVGSAHRAEGFGLSLPCAREMIEQMGGRIWAESAGPGEGSCIAMRLPLS